MGIDGNSIYSDQGGTVLRFRCMFELRQDGEHTENDIITYVQRNLEGEYKFVGGTYYSEPRRHSSNLHLYLEKDSDLMLMKMVFS